MILQPNVNINLDGVVVVYIMHFMNECTGDCERSERVYAAICGRWGQKGRVNNLKGELTL